MGGAELRSDLGTLDKWRRADLLALSQKYVGSNHTLSELRSDISQVQSSSGNAPPHQMPDSKTCKVSEKYFIGQMSETSRTSEDGCRQNCKSTPGCHCIEYYGDSRGCVLVSKGAMRGPS